MTTATQAKPSVLREVTLTRVIDAPRERVFKAWTDASQMAQWWSRLPHPIWKRRLARS